MVVVEEVAMEGEGAGITMIEQSFLPLCVIEKIILVSSSHYSFCLSTC